VPSHTGLRAAVVVTAATTLAMLLIHPRHHMRFFLIRDPVIHQEMGWLFYCEHEK